MQEFEYEMRAMGTDVSVSLVMDNATLAEHAWDEIQKAIVENERRFSRFLPDSELSLLNQQKSIVVSEAFAEVLTVALDLSRETGGAFNPLLQASRLGYRHDFQMTAHTMQYIDEHPYNTSVDDIVIDNTRRVSLQADQELDFGGILKGYLAERLARRVCVDYPSCQGVIINIGGDLHTRGFDADNQPFVFTIDNPITHDPFTIPLTDMSLATSGTYKRRWSTERGEQHHILSPDGHAAMSPYVSVSVMMSDGAAAEAYAKTLLIRGVPLDTVARVPRTCDAILITTDGTNVPYHHS